MPEGDSEHSSGEHAPSRIGNSRQSHPDLLLVEDVKVSQRIASVALGRVHFRVEVAASGEEALEKYAKLADNLKIILMDFGLPGMSGLEASRKIRELEREAKRKPVVIFGLTGSVIESDLPKFIEVGLNGCIAKGKLLGEAVQDALNRLDADPSTFVLMNEQAGKVQSPNKSTKIVAVKPAQLNPEVSSSQAGDLDGIISNGGSLPQRSVANAAVSSSASSSSGVPSPPSSSSSLSSTGLGLGARGEGMLGRSSLAMTLLNRKSTGVRPGVGLPSAEHRFTTSQRAIPAYETDDEESESEYENDSPPPAVCCPPSFLPSSRVASYNNDDVASNSSSSSASDSESKDLGAYEGCDILLVEDVRVSQKIAQSAIQRCGFKVDVASDGETAVTKYTNNLNKYKVVLMDIGLPGISGSDAAQQIRAFESEHKRQPAAILAMTGNVEEESVAGYEQIGMNGCIMKGKQVGASVMEALCRLHAQPDVFVNMCERKAARR